MHTKPRLVQTGQLVAVGVWTWVLVKTRKEYGAIVSSVYHTYGKQSGYGLLLNNASGFYGALAIGKGTLRYVSSGAESLPLGQWHHIAASYDGQRITHYVDGEQRHVAEVATTALNHDPSNDLNLGMFRDDNEKYAFHGQLAEIRIWNRPRTAAEIKADKGKSLRGDEAGLVGYWPLEEGTGLAVKDKSKSSRGGTISGATWEKVEAPFSDTNEQEKADREKAAAEKAERDKAEREVAAGRDASKKLAELEQQLARQAESLAELTAEIKKCGDCEKKLKLLAEEIAALEKTLAAQAKGCDGCNEALNEQKQLIKDLQSRIARLEAQKPTLTTPEPPIWPPPATPPRVEIAYIHFIGSQKGTQGDEFIEIKNTGGSAQDVTDWCLHAGSTTQSFVFPAGSVLAPGATMRVYTNLETQQPGCYSFDSKRALWNDAGDSGHLVDATGNLVSARGYGTKESRSIDSIKAAYGVEGMTLEYTNAQIAEQARRGKIDFMTAVERAIRSLIDDPADEDRVNAANQVRDNYEGVPKNADADLIKRYIRKHLNANQLRLLSEDSEEKSDLDVSTKENWIFAVRHLRDR